RDHRTIDLEVEFAAVAEVLLGAEFELAQDVRRDFWRRQLAIADPDPDDTTRFAADAERQKSRLVANVFDAPAHQPLDRVDRSRWCGHEPALRLASNENRSLVAERDDRRHERVAAVVADHRRSAVVDVRDEAIRGSEVDADDFAHGSGLRATARGSG